ncbi:MAG TPA: hypothetical protein VFL76_09330 [Edaphocola sp.]|nr:hypothetical protein [Edaphocola sp.]
MKKIILSIAVLGVCAFTTTYAQVVSAESATVAPAPATEQTKLPELPKFTSEAANKGVADLTALFKEYAPAIKAKDTAKIMEFATKVQSFQQSATWISDLSADEQQVFQKYMHDLGEALIGDIGHSESAPDSGNAPTE